MSNSSRGVQRRCKKSASEWDREDLLSMAAEAESSNTLEEKKTKPPRKRQRVQGEKICQVCGDKALAHHFGTLACETCKAFFRRNALFKEQRKCLFKGDCPISVKTRRFCPACRLAKCFKMGMQADLILDEKEKKQRLQKISEKRSKQDACEDQQQPPGSHSESMISPAECAMSATVDDVARSPVLMSNMMEQAWAAASELSAMEMAGMGSPGSISLDCKWNQDGLTAPLQTMEMVLSSPESLVMDQGSGLAVHTNKDSVVSPTQVEFSYPPTPNSSVMYQSDIWSPPMTAPAPPPLQPPPPPPTQRRDQERFSDLSISFAEKCQYLSAFQHISRDALPSDPYMYWRLSEEERCLLTQLSAAYQDTLLAVLHGSPPRETISLNLITPEFYLEECDIEARKAISFAKRMEDFRMLRLDEQVAVLKASTCQVIGLQACALYIPEKSAWLTEKGYFTENHMRLLLPQNPLHDLEVAFCRTIKSIVKNDVTLYALLHCVMLFDPSNDRIIDRQLINSIRDKYIILLRHYLESVYSYSHSEKYIMALQENLVFFRNLCQEGKPLIKKFFPSIPNKLLMEVLDIE